MKNTNYIYGLRAVIEAVESGKEIDKVMMASGLTGDLAQSLLQKLKEHRIYIQRVPVERLNRITGKNHQGVIAQVSPIEYYKLEQLVPTLYEDGKIPMIVVLDGITDTRNFGAIARTAECAGVDAIVIPQRGSVSVTPDAVKTSAGALLRIPVCREESISQALRYLQQSGITIVGATEKGNNPYTSVDYTIPIAVVMGAEDTGLSESSLRICDKFAAIPILGSIGSLNVSVAAAVIIYEAVKQKLI